MLNQRTPDSRTIIQLAARADCCIATIRRYYTDRPLRPRSRSRIEAALKELGMPLRPEPATMEAAVSGRE